MASMDFSDKELEDLYRTYGGVLYQRCLSILHNEEAAQDAVQETFARVIVHADSFREQASPLTWMYRISTNYCLNLIRNQGTRRSKLATHHVDIIGEGVQLPGESEPSDHSRILELLNQEDEDTKRCVIHTFFDECTRQEVATLVGLSVPTVRKRINLFLAHARRVLGSAAVFCILCLDYSSCWSVQ